jgi:PEP-CTERM motif
MRTLILTSILATMAAGIPAYGAPLIINEWNAVGAGKVLAGGDTFFNANYVAPTGNGSNWVELVVTQDHLDIRGWKLEWSNLDPDSGNLVFTNNALWSDVRSGTIITLREDDVGDAGNPVGARPSNVSFNPGANDFWIEINVDDALYIIENGFKTDNDEWRGTIRDNANNVIQGPVGEDAGAPWSGGGINSTEVGALGLSPTASPIAAGYRDVTYSSYGAANWLNASGTQVQNFTALRAWVPEPSSFVLAALAASGAAVAVWRRRGR